MSALLLDGLAIGAGLGPASVGVGALLGLAALGSALLDAHLWRRTRC